jgi:hypothetical protein
MTLAVLTRPGPVRAGPDRPSLEQELEALLAGEPGECLVCGEPVELERGRVECRACGSVLEPFRRPHPGQLSLL